MLQRVRVKVFCLVLGMILGFSSLAMSQRDEIEPNDTCPTAQDVGAVTLPFVLNGRLDADVDFFRFIGTPGTLILIDLEGGDTGAGTLVDPFLGLFDANCNLLTTNDDGGSGLNSRFLISIPSDGIFTLAVTQCCDDLFQGGGEGSYLLTLSPAPPPIGAITGRVVNAETDAPLSGQEEPFAFVELRRCNNGDCFDFVNGQSTDSDGRFRFETDFEGNLLLVGTYQVVAVANHFEQS